MGSSKKQTVGYKYLFGVHMGIGRGPVDALHEIRVADKQAWFGKATGNTTIQINKPNLFGGDDKEGGVKGPLELMMGESDQEASSGLKTMLGSVLPGFRGAFTAFYNGLVSVNNPYPKPWKFRLNRTLKGWDGTPWYPEKCRITLVEEVPETVWGHNFTFSDPVVNDEGLAEYVAPAGTFTFANMWLRSTVPFTGRKYVEFDLKGPAPAGCYVGVIGRTAWDSDSAAYPANPYSNPTYLISNNNTGGSQPGPVVNGVELGTVGTYFTAPCTVGVLIDYSTRELKISVNGGPLFSYSLPAGDFDPYLTAYVTPTRSHTVAIRKYANQWKHAPTGATPFGQPFVPGAYSMNAAHIIYECLTNRVWGRGLDVAKLDVASFFAAANTLFAENFGLCLKWTRKDSIENFIQGVIDHIGATLYVSRTTKLYTIKLIRGNYDLNDLPLFDTESGILSISDASVASIGSTVNAVQVKYRDWQNDEEGTVSVKNSASIVAAGGIVNQVSRDFPGIPTPTLALRVAQRELRAVSTALRKFTITMDRRGEDFAPGDVFAIQDPKRGLPKMAVRVGRVEDGTLLDGKITLTVVQDVFTLPVTTMAADVPSTWVPPNTQPCIDQQRVIEAPYFLMVRNLSKSELDYVGQDSGYIATLNSRGQPLNQGYKIAVRPDAPTSDDNASNDSYTCGL